MNALRFGRAADGLFMLEAELWLSRRRDELLSFFAAAFNLQTLTLPWLEFEVQPDGNVQSSWSLEPGVLVWSLALVMNTAAASDEVLFDFRVSTSLPAWHIANDDVMGGVFTSRFQVLTNGGAVFSGAVSLENNGGFSSVRSALVRMNLSSLEAFVLRARGDGRRYKFTVRTETGFDTPLHQCMFTAKPGGSQEHRLAFKDFVPTSRGRVLTGMPPLEPARVTSVGFLIADRQDGSFRLEMD